nr:hypothetical protein Cry52Nrm2_p133 [Cryptomonas curvata]
MKTTSENSILVLKRNWNNKKTNNDHITLSILRSINSVDYYQGFKEFGNLLNDQTIFSFNFLQNKNIRWFWNNMICFKIYFKLYMKKFFSSPLFSIVFNCMWLNKFLEYYFFIRRKYKLLTSKLYYKKLIDFIKKKKSQININFSLIYLLKIKINCNLVYRLYRNTWSIYKSSNFLSETIRNFFKKKFKNFLKVLFFCIDVKLEIFFSIKSSLKIIKYYQNWFGFRSISKILIKYLFKFIKNN